LTNDPPDESEYSEATLILQLLKDNVELWNEEAEAEISRSHPCDGTKKYVEVNNLSQRLAGTCFSEKRTDVSEGGGHSKDTQQVGTTPRIEDGSE
jgi:hypothetical protein